MLFSSQDIDENPLNGGHFEKIQDGGHLGIRANWNIIFLITIGFCGPENGGLAVKIKFLGYLVAGILTKTPFTAAILKIQDGGHKGLGANGNIGFLIAYTITFPKMYSFQTLQKNPTKLHNEPH